MALKGQKFKTFTNEERTEIVNKYMSGKYSYTILAKEYNISRDCLWQRLYVLNWNVDKALLTKPQLRLK